MKLKDEKKNISLQRHIKQHNEGSGTMQCVKTEIQLDAAECYLNNMGGTRQLQAGQTSYIQAFLDTHVSLAPTHVCLSVRRLVGWLVILSDFQPATISGRPT